MSKTICIDPGHGGYDPGAVAPDGTREKDLTLDISMRLKKKIESRGFGVVMTRDWDRSPWGLTDTSRELQARCDIADDAGVDLFLSIHINAGGGVGAEAFVWPGGRATPLAGDLIRALAPTMGVHGLAIKDGGPRGERFKVICGTDAPAILLEIGFIDSPDLFKIKNNIPRIVDALSIPLIKFLTED